MEKHIDRGTGDVNTAVAAGGSLFDNRLPAHNNGTYHCGGRQRESASQQRITTDSGADRLL